MKKIVLLSVFVIGVSGVFAQQTTLLEKYRSMALEYNHDLKAAEKNIGASIELEKSALKERNPKLGAGANFQYTGNPMELTLDVPSVGRTFRAEGREMKYGASLSLMQPVYTGGQVLESIKMARYRHSIAEEQAEAIRSLVCYQTDIQYWNTAARREIAGVAEDFRNSIASLVKIIQERVDVGLVDPQDLLMAEVRLNDADYQLLQARNSFETGRMALNSIIGAELYTPTEIEREIPAVQLNDSLRSVDGRRRPEIRMALDRIKLAESSLKFNDAKYKPQLYAGVDGSYSSPGYNFHADMDPNYAVYAKLSIPVFEWGKRKNEKRASTYRVGAATDDLNKVLDNVNLEVQTARLSLMQAMEQVRLSENSLGKAYENERKALERYGEGKVSVTEVIDAQTYRQTAQMNHVRAKMSAQTCYSGLIKALHGYDYSKM